MFYRIEFSVSFVNIDKKVFDAVRFKTVSYLTRIQEFLPHKFKLNLNAGMGYHTGRLRPYIPKHAGSLHEKASLH